MRRIRGKPKDQPFDQRVQLRHRFQRVRGRLGRVVHLEVGDEGEDGGVGDEADQHDEELPHDGTDFPALELALLFLLHLADAVREVDEARVARHLRKPPVDLALLGGGLAAPRRVDLLEHEDKIPLGEADVELVEAVGPAAAVGVEVRQVPQGVVEEDE